MSSVCWKVLVALGVVVQFGCRGPATANDAAFIQGVFSGFVYGGTEKELSQDQFTGGIPQSHLPNQLRAEEAYIFYLPKEAAEIGAWTQIRDRLLHSGAEIVRGPKAAGDLLHLTVGGPIFEFRFRYRGRLGSIRNEFEPRIANNERLSRLWALERYVIRFDG
jgi:hypothetical protein